MNSWMWLSGFCIWCIFWKYLLKNQISIYANHICITFTEKNTPVICYHHIEYVLTHNWYMKKSTSSINARFYTDTCISSYDFPQK